MDKRQKISILGATGSIGQSTLDVIAQHPERYHIFAVSAFHNIDKLVQICQQFSPQIVAIPQEHVALFREKIQQQQLICPEIVVDEQGLIQIAEAPEVDIVMAAIVGAAGLLPTLAAVKAGKRVLLANKEALVMSGELMMQTAQQSQAQLLPVDSEHNAIFQCLPEYYFQHRQANKQPQLGVQQLLLTASGGPFLHFTLAQLQDVSPEQACKHPNWSMGRKISVDSATLMNKGLELIEACHLFALDEQYIRVVIHPQSIVHSMVQYVDGSTLAQMGSPDMRTPIAHALAFPQRLPTNVKTLDLFEIGQLNFYPPDAQRFPALNLARQAMRQGGTAPTVLNAANEVAVDAFLHEKIGFVQIGHVVEQVLQQSQFEMAQDLQAILQADRYARQIANRIIQNLT